MQKFIYFDCPSGAAGDMILGAFLDGLVPEAWLSAELAKMNLPGFHLETERVDRHAISCNKLHVRTDDKQDHRHLDSIIKMINSSALSKNVQRNVIEVFNKLGSCEAAVHNIPLQKVHFHEVGAIDSIVDIVGTCLCIDYLKAQHIYASALPSGHGTIRSAHGVLPVPAPATSMLLQGFPQYKVDVEGELVTPTGAALIRHFARGDLPHRQAYKMIHTGYGAGDKDFKELPNYIRIAVGQWDDTFDERHLLQFETQIDDMPAEFFPDLRGALFEAGALDVIFIPANMKHGRPGTLLQGLVHEEGRQAIEQVVFENSSSIGVRFFAVRRTELPRKPVTINSPWGELQVKETRHAGQIRLHVEYRECERLAKEKNETVWAMYQKIAAFVKGKTDSYQV